MLISKEPSATENCRTVRGTGKGKEEQKRGLESFSTIYSQVRYRAKPHRTVTDREAGGVERRLEKEGECLAERLLCTVNMQHRNLT
jgi:hypothetical protein